MSRTYWDTLRRYFWFNDQELKILIISIFVFAFCISFNEWGTAKFDFLVGLRNYFLAVIIMTITMLIHETGRRMAATKLGFKVQTTFWWYGLILALGLCILSGGHIWFLASTGFIIHLLPVHRLGFFRYGPNPESMALVGIAGPLFNIIFATIIKTCDVWFNLGITSIPFIFKLFMVNWIFAVCNLLPIPPLDGIKLLFYSRLHYAFAFGAIAGYIVLVYLGGIYSYFLALIVGIIVWLSYLVFFEKGYIKFKK